MRNVQAGCAFPAAGKDSQLVTSPRDHETFALPTHLPLAMIGLRVVGLPFRVGVGVIIGLGLGCMCGVKIGLLRTGLMSLIP